MLFSASSWTYLILWRLAQGLLVVFAVVSIVFVVSRVTADPIEYLASDQATEEDIKELQEAYGLRRPLIVQYAVFLLETAHLDLGTSYISGRPAIDEVSARVGKTVQLGAAALLFALTIGVPLGVIAALYRGTPLDWASRLIAVFGQAMPSFFLGLMMISLFSVKLGWLPTGGSGSLKHLLMPMVVLSMPTCAVVMRMTRSGMIDVMGTDFIRTARAKGLRGSTVVTRHALRHALLPVSTLLGIQLGRLIAGSVIVEVVFAWPGVGRLVITAIETSDYPVTQAAIMLIATAIVLSNLLVDLLYRIIDPRIGSGAA